MNKYLRRLGIGIALASMLNTGCAYTVKYKGIDKSVEKSTKRGNTVRLYVNAGVAKEMKIGFKYPKKADRNLDGLVSKDELKYYVANLFRSRAARDYDAGASGYNTVDSVVTGTSVDPSQPNQ